MKTKQTANILIIFILLMAFQLHGQQLTYLEGTIDYEGEQVSTFQVNLEPEPSAVEKAIDAWFSQNHDINLKDKSLLFFNKKFLTAKEVVITEISKGPINLVVRAEKDNTSLTTLYVFSSNADGFITPDTQPSAFRGAKKGHQAIYS